MAYGIGLIWGFTDRSDVDTLDCGVIVWHPCLLSTFRKLLGSEAGGHVTTLAQQMGTRGMDQQTSDAQGSSVDWET